MLFTKKRPLFREQHGVKPMTEMISATILLLLIMDPLGNLPIFMSVLKHLEPKRRRVVLIREMFGAVWSAPC